MMGQHSFQGQREAGQRYNDRWKAMVAEGRKPVVISRFGQAVLWGKWRTYYRQQGLHAIVDLMDDGRIEKTVPCLDPFDFDVPAEVGPDRRVKDD